MSCRSQAGLTAAEAARRLVPMKIKISHILVFDNHVSVKRR